MDDTQMPAPASWTIKLGEPVEALGMSLTELKLREPTMAELLAATAESKDGGQLGMMRMQMHLVCLVSGVSRPVVEKLPWPVVVGAADWLLSFKPAAPATPAT